MEDGAVPTPWERVAETVKRRRAELGLSQRAAALLADISPTTWGNLETHGQPVTTLTAAGISRALRWTSDSVDRILAGLDPMPDEGAPEPVTMDGLMKRIETLATAVADLAERFAALEARRPPRQ